MGIDLGKQVGPLPLGAWIVVVGGGLGIAYWGYRQQTPIEAIDTSGDPGVGDGSVGGWVPTSPGSGGNDDSVAPKPTTNEEWAQQVINGMIARGYPPAQVDQAIRKYISGSGTLSVSEWAIITVALSLYGSPPSPLPPREQNPTTPTPTVPKPPAPVPTKPPVPKPPVPKPPARPAVRYYVVEKGDSLWKISVRYYRSGIYWGRIYNANRYGVRRADGTWGMIKNPNLIYPNWRLIIP